MFTLIYFPYKYRDWIIRTGQTIPLKDVKIFPLNSISKFIAAFTKSRHFREVHAFIIYFCENHVSLYRPPMIFQSFFYSVEVFSQYSVRFRVSPVSLRRNPSFITQGVPFKTLPWLLHTNPLTINGNKWKLLQTNTSCAQKLFYQSVLRITDYFKWKNTKTFRWEDILIMKT